MFETLGAQLTPRPWLLGERFTAADALGGLALHWTTASGAVPKMVVVDASIPRVTPRQATVRAQQKDAPLAAAQAAGSGRRPLARSWSIIVLRSACRPR